MNFVLSVLSSEASSKFVLFRLEIPDRRHGEQKHAQKKRKHSQILCEEQESRRSQQE